MKNSELIRPNSIDRDCQAEKIHSANARESVKMPCPNCGHEQNVYDALGITIDDYNTNRIIDSPMHCVNCKRELKYAVPFIAIGNSWHWCISSDFITKRCFLGMNLAC